MKIPMLATLVDKPFDGEDWIFEVKWDGYRALAHKKKKVILLSRGQKPWNEKFPTIAQELKKIPGQCILDGEIVILDKKGKSNFQMLQNYQKEKKGIPLYYVFDILSYQGKDLTKFSGHIEKKGKAFFQKAKKKREEGIIAKKKLSTYQFHRSRDWLKIKTGLRQEVVIGGFTQPKGSRHRFGALLVGVYSKGHLIYVGHVGSGFSRESLEEMHQKLKKIGSLKCPFQTEPDPNMPVSWVRPRLVCEVSFAEWTKDGKMRQPIFRGLRVDKSPKSVIRERSS
jgi:bifunctional non-homologous end joining protein LigD